MFATVDWNTVAVVAGAVAVVLYPPLGVMWRWFRHVEDRFDEVDRGIINLQTGDTVDVRDLQAFKDDVGRRIQRIEDHVWRS